MPTPTLPLPLHQRPPLPPPPLSSSASSPSSFLLPFQPPPPLLLLLLRRPRRSDSFSCHSSTSRSGNQNTNVTSPKTGLVGTHRLKEGAVPGTYWADAEGLGEEVLVRFNKGNDDVCVSARAGENLLRVAERCGVMVPNNDFCFEGTCCHCEMEVVDGAHEVGYRAESDRVTLVRSCICPVPRRRNLEVKLISEEDVWSEGVV